MSEIQKNYDASHIQVLEGLEAVRKRPAMFIGDTSTVGLHRLVSEVVDNCINEALAGYCNDVQLFILPDNSIQVIDNGRDVPEEKHQMEHLAALEVVMTVLQAGGEFGKNTLKSSGDYHRAGVRCVKTPDCIDKQTSYNDLFAGSGCSSLSIKHGIFVLDRIILANALVDHRLYCQEVFVDIFRNLNFGEEYSLLASTGDDAVPIVVPARDFIYNNVDNKYQILWFVAGRGSGGLPYLPSLFSNHDTIVDNKYLNYSLLIPKIITASERIEAANSLAA